MTAAFDQAHLEMQAATSGEVIFLAVAPDGLWFRCPMPVEVVHDPSVRWGEALERLYRDSVDEARKK